MTPIKVGEYEVREVRNPWGRYEIRTPNGEPLWASLRQKPDGALIHTRCFHSRSTALYLAADAAGIERQRVEVGGNVGHGCATMRAKPLLPGTPAPDGWDGGGYIVPMDAWHHGVLQREIGQAAHVYARARYAALTEVTA